MARVITFDIVLAVNQYSATAAVDQFPGPGQGFDWRTTTAKVAFGFWTVPVAAEGLDGQIVNVMAIMLNPGFQIQAVLQATGLVDGLGGGNNNGLGHRGEPVV
jgi:hypothetical protein